MKYRYRIILFLVLFLFLSMFFLKNPIREYKEIQDSNYEQLTKKFVQLKYSYYWREAYSLYGEDTINENAIVTLTKEHLYIWNQPFSQKLKPQFMTKYTYGNIHIETEIDLDNDEINYFYKVDENTSLTKFSINDDKVKKIIEKSKNISLDNLRKDTKNYKNNFIKDLNKIKTEKLGEIKSDIMLRIYILIAAFVLSFFLITLFSLVKV